MQRRDKGKQRISEYWEEFVKTTYEKSIKDKHPLSLAEVVREVKRHAIVALGLEEGDYPHPATIYRVLQPLIEHQNRKKRVRNPGSGSWLAVDTNSLNTNDKIKLQEYRLLQQLKQLPLGSFPQVFD